MMSQSEENVRRRIGEAIDHLNGMQHDLCDINREFAVVIGEYEQVLHAQIQSHFLHNSLAMIEALCVENPPLAKSAILKFAHYLKKSAESLNSIQPIPFADELTHVKNYLALEKIRFGEKLTVAYDIRTEGFSLPPLTVQTLAENAVRYGVTKRRGGGTLAIESDEEDRQFVVKVRDNGIGFDASAKRHDEDGYVGIKNTTKRLEMQCGGTLSIESRKGRGTTAVIKIPRRERR